MRDFGNYLYDFKIGEILNLDMKESIIRNIPDAPEKFKSMTINQNSVINDMDNNRFNFSGKRFVFINTDEHSELSLSDDELELFLRLTN